MNRNPTTHSDRESDTEDQSMDIASALRAAKSGRQVRTPAQQATAKIGAFDLAQALAKSRVDDDAPISEPPPTLRPEAPAPQASADAPAPLQASTPAATPHRRASRLILFLVAVAIAVAVAIIAR